MDLDALHTTVTKLNKWKAEVEGLISGVQQLAADNPKIAAAIEKAVENAIAERFPQIEEALPILERVGAMLPDLEMMLADYKKLKDPEGMPAAPEPVPAPPLIEPPVIEPAVEPQPEPAAPEQPAPEPAAPEPPAEPQP